MHHWGKVEKVENGTRKSFMLLCIFDIQNVVPNVKKLWISSSTFKIKSQNTARTVTTLGHSFVADIWNTAMEKILKT